MSFREWNAVVELSAQALGLTWVVLNINTAQGVAGAAAMVLWAMAVIIGISIVGAIIASILIGIARRDGTREDRADERDRAIHVNSMRNAYFVSSISVLIVLILLAMGMDPVLAVYVLFGGGILAGAVNSFSQLVYYRIG